MNNVIVTFLLLWPIFPKALSTGVFPESLKIATVIPAFKQDDLTILSTG